MGRKDILLDLLALKFQKILPYVIAMEVFNSVCVITDKIVSRNYYVTVSFDLVLRAFIYCIYQSKRKAIFIIVMEAFIVVFLFISVICGEYPYHVML